MTTCEWNACTAGLRPVTSASVAAAWFSLIGGILGFICGLIVFLRGFVLLRREQRISDTPLSKIAGAALGPVALFGKVVGPYTLLSPLSEVDCYYYRAIALGGQDEEGRPWEGAAECMFTPFFLEDETGRVMIDPRSAQLDLPPEYDSQVSPSDMDPSCTHFLARHGLLGAGSATVREFTIKAGDELFVLGRVAENRGLTSMAECPPGALPRVGEAYLSAEAAWLQKRQMLEEMGVAAMDLPLAPPASDPGFDLHPAVVVGKGEDHEPFVLARQRPQRMVRELARQATTFIWAGPVLALLSLGLLLWGLDLW